LLLKTKERLKLKLELLMDEYELPPQKGMDYFRHTSMESEIIDASTSIRRWWWEYLKLSKDYWLVCQTSTFGMPATIDKKLAKLYEDFGDIYTVKFEDWWRRTGSYLFAEQSDPPSVEQITSAQSSKSGNRAGKILVEIPLQLSRETVQVQINRILDQYSDERPRNRLETSTSRYPIEPVLSRLNVIKQAHEVYCLHREIVEKPKALARLGLRNDMSTRAEEASLFRIGKIYGLSPQNANLIGEVDVRVRKANLMRREVRRVLDRAITLIHHVERGRFAPINETPTRHNNSRFTDEQLDIHQELEHKWWNLDLYSTLSENKIAEIRGIRYATGRRY
jgi:hypothetical protein